MLANKTNCSHNWLLIITAIFSVLLATLTFLLLNFHILALKIKISYIVKIFLGVLAIIFYTNFDYKKWANLNNFLPGKLFILNFSNKEKRLEIAIKQLGNQKIEKRLIGIDNLEKIAQDFPALHWEIMEMLTIFIRNNTAFKPQTEVENNSLPTIRADIQAALTVIGRRDASKDAENQQLDLSYVDITGVNLNNANLQGANLYQTNLFGANLVNANLQQTILCAANLSGANLNRANLSGAILSAANLSTANLTQANLSKANLFLANLCGANLNDANLCGANLRDTNFCS